MENINWKKEARDMTAFFAAIPEEKWIAGSCGTPGSGHCAIGHCLYYKQESGGYMNFAKADMLRDLFMFIETDAPLVNDGDHPKYQQRWPKARILAAMEDIKAAIDNQYVEEPVYEHTDEEIGNRAVEQVMQFIQNIEYEEA